MKKINVILMLIISLLLMSCFKDDDTNFESFSNIEIVASADEAVINTNVTLTVLTNNGEDVTNEATFIVDGVETNSNILMSPVVKTISVVAKFKGVNSTVKNVKFSITVNGFVKRVLVEDYTGTWCGNCPRVTHALGLIKLQTDKVVEVAIHRGTPQQNEPYLFDALVLEQLVGVSGYPAARINRTGIWSAPQQNNLNQVISETQGALVKAGLAMENTVINGNVNLKVKVGFKENFSNLKLVVYVLENGLIYDQVNYTTFYGGLDPIPNFVHNHTLRSCVTQLLGDAIPNSNTIAENIFTRDFNFAVPSNVADDSKIEFVAFVVDSNNKAINVRKCLPNVTQSLELL